MIQSVHPKAHPHHLASPPALFLGKMLIAKRTLDLHEAQD